MATGPIRAALTLPNGARFYRCALQVNPFDYLGRHRRSAAFKDEASYNDAIVRQGLELGIEVIAITDHYRVKTSESLRQAAEAAGIRVFPAFEAVTKDGVHFLCLFDPSRDVDYLERIVGACGVHEDRDRSPVGSHDARELLAESPGWGAICIAAHVTSGGGLLTTLKGQPAINAWKSPQLFACSLPGPVSDTPAHLRPILENKDPNYRRERLIAVLNAQDVSGPDDLSKPGTSCWIKMSEVSVEGLRQAFLDPESRICLASDPLPEGHGEFVALTWQGGFLDGAAIHFNEGLNVLIGGRGAGKSTVVESLRYVLGLDPLGEETRRLHEGIIRHVLRSGTKVSLLVRSHRPAKREYLIERTVPNPVVVRDADGALLTLAPTEVLPGVEIYGQHELSELARSPEKLTRLLDRFVERHPDLVGRKRDLRREMERSRLRMMELRKELAATKERLAALPGLEQTLRRFEDAGLEERLKEQSLLVREERVVNSAFERLIPLQTVLGEFKREIPIDFTFLSPKALGGLPGATLLAEAREVLDRLSREFKRLTDEMEQALASAETGLLGVRGRWEERKRAVQDAYEQILRELQKSRVDGEEFLRLRKVIEHLRPLRERQTGLERELGDLAERRQALITEWEDTKAEEFRHLDRAAKKATRGLAGHVRVQVTFAGNREPLVELLREQVAGRLSEALEVLRHAPELSLGGLAAAVRAGRDALSTRFGISAVQAERLAQISDEAVMRIEELDLPPTTRIELNVAAEQQPPAWQELADLSTGQRATAVLLLALLESEGPLVVDQPEDDLDNRFIAEGFVPKMREQKRRRQLLFSTHNANVPVLGDAELIAGLRPSGEAALGRAGIPPEHMGSIDARAVRDLVEELLEGGRQAFETRRLKYGF